VAWCESELTILIITRFLLPPRNEEKIVLLLRANPPLRGIVARGRRAEIRAGIGGKVGDVSGGDSFQIRADVQVEGEPPVNAASELSAGSEERATATGRPMANIRSTDAFQTCEAGRAGMHLPSEAVHRT